MARILVISFTNLGRDVRVRRQLFHLRQEHDVTAIGLGDHAIPGVDSLRVPELAAYSLRHLTRRVARRICHLSRTFDWGYWLDHNVQSALWLSDAHPWDLVIGNDLDSLPLAIRIASKAQAKVIVDMHEWEAGRLDDDSNWMKAVLPYVDSLCNTYLPQVDAGLTVCDSIAKLYEDRYGVAFDVHHNMPFYNDLTPSPVNPASIRLVYHGGVNASRQTENLLRVAELLEDRFELNIIPVGNPQEVQRLKDMARGIQRVHFRPTVASESVPAETNQYDIGLFPLAPTNTSYRFALPNKFFEFIQARLAIAIWPSPEMAQLVTAHDLGLVSDAFTAESLASRINDLTAEEIQSYKSHADAVAGTYCAEKNCERLLSLVNSLLGKKESHLPSCTAG